MPCLWPNRPSGHGLDPISQGDPDPSRFTQSSAKISRHQDHQDRESLENRRLLVLFRDLIRPWDRPLKTTVVLWIYSIMLCTTLSDSSPGATWTAPTPLLDSREIVKGRGKGLSRDTLLFVHGIESGSLANCARDSTSSTQLW